jgi:adenosylcobinamide kinase/adenosylcobinamide-phosphate guanylyltransferase
MARTVLITGGCRSGKSRQARLLAESAGEKRVYIATAPVVDAEMEERIASHRAERLGRGWETIEERTDLAGALRRCAGYDVVLCDCLTLWVNNLMYEASPKGHAMTEADMARLCAEVREALQDLNSLVVLVTNEVGMGVVPADATTRRFRDLAGRCNLEIAAMADEVILMVSGLPMPLKGKGREHPQ